MVTARRSGFGRMASWRDSRGSTVQDYREWHRDTFFMLRAHMHSLVLFRGAGLERPLFHKTLLS